MSERHAKRAHAYAPPVALFVVKISRTLRVVTPVLLTEMAAETHPPTSMGIDTMSGGEAICVTMPLETFEYEKEADTLPPLPPVNNAATPILRKAELNESSCKNAKEFGNGAS